MLAGDQPRGRRPGSARSRAVFSALAIALIAATALAATAGAASAPDSHAAFFPGSELFKKKPKDPRIPQRDIKRLRTAKCPAPYLIRVDRDYDPTEIRAARNFRFDIAGQDVTLRPPINWRLDPINSASFRARLHDLRWLDILLYDYRHNHNRASLKKAKRVVVDWIKSNPRSAPTTDRTWFDKVVGERASYIAYVTRAAACAGMVNGKLPQKLLGSVLTHGRFLLSKSNYTHTNRGLFEDYGLLQVGKQVPWLQGAGKWRRRGEQRFAHTVKQLTYADEGLWLEHSTTYHFLAEGIIEAYLKTPGVKQPAIRALLPKMKAAAGWLIEPDNHWLQAGNSYQDGAGTEARAAAKKTRGLGWFPRSGMAFVRTGNTYLAVLSDFHSSTHKHSDELSFDLYDHGGRLISDTGMYSKDPSQFLDFQLSARAHSTLTVDGQGFPRDSRYAYGSGLQAAGVGDGWYAIEATNPLVKHQGVDNSRTWLYKPHQALIVLDRVRSGQSHDYRRYLQFGQGLKLDAQPDRLELIRKGKPVADVFSETTAPAQQRRYAKGDEKDPMAGLIFPDFRDVDKRWTAWFDTRGDDVDHAFTISLKAGDHAFHAALGSSLDTNPVRVDVDRGGKPRFSLFVTRDGGKLAVKQVDAHKQSG